MITHLTKIGNSFGIILNKKMLQQLGISSSKEIHVEMKEGAIIITAPKNIPVNTDRATWGDQFKKAFRKGQKPEKSIWPDNMSSNADTEWTW